MSQWSSLVQVPLHHAITYQPLQRHITANSPYWRSPPHRQKSDQDLIPQVIDRHTPPADTVRYSTHLHNTLGDPDREWYCTIEANKALIALCKDGGGPVHINLTTTYSPDFSVVEPPKPKRLTTLPLLTYYHRSLPTR